MLPWVRAVVVCAVGGVVLAPLPFPFPAAALGFAPLPPDCNHNGVPDEDDIAFGVSEDCNANGVPDECEDYRGFAAARMISGAAGDGPHSLIAVDLNNDNHLDLAITYWEEEKIRVLVNDGNGAFSEQPPSPYSSPEGAQRAGQIKAADLNGDGALDLVVGFAGRAGQNTGGISVFFNAGDATFTPGPFINLNANSVCVGVGDFDDDDDMDVATGHVYLTANNLRILTNDGAGNLTLGPAYNAGMRPYDVGVADLNSDDCPDLAVPNSTIYSAGTVTVFLNRCDGTGTFFSPPQTYPTGGLDAVAVTISDFDQDEDNDLAISNYMSGNISVLLNDGAGVFGSPVTYPTGDGPAKLDGADVDRDGDDDLVVPNHLGDTIVVLLNDGGAFAADEFGPYPRYRPHTVAVADLDEDEDQDIGVTSWLGDAVFLLANRWRYAGDLNCDGAVNFGDINPFVLRLSNEAAYLAAYPCCPNENGDINADGGVNFGDINPFVALLTGS